MSDAKMTLKKVVDLDMGNPKWSSNPKSVDYEARKHGDKDCLSTLAF